MDKDKDTDIDTGNGDTTAHLEIYDAQMDTAVLIFFYRNIMELMKLSLLTFLSNIFMFSSKKTKRTTWNNELGK